MAEAESLDALREVMAESWEFLELAGCNRPISSLQQREALLEDLVGFTMITRMQLPLQRYAHASLPTNTLLTEKDKQQNAKKMRKDDELQKKA